MKEEDLKMKIAVTYDNLDNGLYPRARQNNGRVCLSVQWLREQWSEVNHGCG